MFTEEYAQEIENLVTDELIKLGFSTKYNGFPYLLYFITHFEDTDRAKHGVGALAVEMAKVFDCNKDHIFRCINVLTEAALKTDNFMLKKLFPYNEDNKLTEKTALAAIHQYINPLIER